MKKTKNPANDQLIQAASDGNLADIKEVLKNKAEINFREEYGDTALNKAASQGHIEVVKFLVESGADIHNMGGADKTPIMSAAFSGHANIVAYLIEKGAKVSRSMLSSVNMKVNILRENTEMGMVKPGAAEAWEKFLEYLVGVYEKQQQEE